MIFENILGYLREFLTNELIGKLFHILILILVGVLIHRIIPRVLGKLILKTKINQSERKIQTLLSIATSILNYFIYIAVFYNILLIFGFNEMTLLSIFSVFGVAIGLGSQNFARDIMNGFFINIEDQFSVSDHVVINNITGVVEEIGLRTTVIRAPDGTVHIIPNSMITIVANRSRGFSKAIINAEISSTTDIDRVLFILKDEMITQKAMVKEIINVPVVIKIEQENMPVKIRVIADCAIGEKENIEGILRDSINKRLQDENIYHQKTLS